MKRQVYALALSVFCAWSIPAAADPSPSPTPSPSAARVRCANAIRQFLGVNQAVFNDYGRYVAASRDTDDSNRNGLIASARMQTFSYAGAELDVISKLVQHQDDAYAPALQVVDSSGFDRMAAAIDKLHADVVLRNKYAKSWAQNRYNYFSDLANGQADTYIDQTPQASAAHLTQTITEDVSAVDGDPTLCPK